ncbi:MAG: Glutamine--scyllo-inositol transaminase, partial [Chitinophagaceae bacterium]|nr:Glutamine--scyllo-inositol transaminase [Chitinophagaceae bacterium]
MNSERILLSAPHMSGFEQKYVNEAFESNWIVPLGPNVDAFEKELSRITGMEALAVVSGTSALHLALILLNVGPGDFVFCQSLTFSASANPIAYQRATPVFI